MEKKIIALILLVIVGFLGVTQLNITQDGFRGFLSKEQDFRKEFEDFMWKHDKVYNDIDEESKRFEIFIENFKKVVKHNSEDHSFKVAINKFSDLSHEEFVEFYTGYKSDKTIEERLQEGNFEKTDENLSIPQKVDWRFSSPPKVGPVYDQGHCGSCWAFSTAQAVEGLYPSVHGRFQQFSAQEVLDCADLWYLEFGCHGGDYQKAFDMIRSKGICELDKYAHSYQAKKLSCKEKECKSRFKIKGHHDCIPLDKDSLLKAIAKQPVSISIDANSWAFSHYSQGIIKEGCGIKLDHAVLAVGYDLKENYILVKNSWGSWWGDNGYVKLAITEGSGTCGINIAGAYPHY